MTFYHGWSTKTYVFGHLFVPLYGWAHDRIDSALSRPCRRSGFFEVSSTSIFIMIVLSNQMFSGIFWYHRMGARWRGRGLRVGSTASMRGHFFSFWCNKDCMFHVAWLEAIHLFPCVRVFGGSD